jgi:hypothetical protein
MRILLRHKKRRDEKEARAEAVRADDDQSDTNQPLHK